jgi:hypothetical protein
MEQGIDRARFLPRLVPGSSKIDPVELHRAPRAFGIARPGALRNRFGECPPWIGSSRTRALARKKVTVYDFPDGRIEVRHQGLALPYRTFDRITRVDQGTIVENKRLSEALEMCRAMQAELPPKLRSRKAPARTSQPQHMFAAR